MKFFQRVVRRILLCPLRLFFAVMAWLWFTAWYDYELDDL